MPKVPRTRKTRDAIESEAHWSKLPYPAMVEVYKHLADTHRVSASQVCSAWEDAFYNPSLWRYKHFVFGGSKANSSGHKAAQFVRTFASYLQRVDVSVVHLNRRSCPYESIANTLDEFCGHLGKADLHHFVLKNLEMQRFWNAPLLTRKITNALIELLTGQTHLQTLEFPFARFSLVQGTQVLAAASAGSGSSITNLKFQEFFNVEAIDFNSGFSSELGNYINALRDFTSLRTISLSYCCLSNRVVENWASVLAGKLELLVIQVAPNERRAGGVSSQSWTLLKTACPRVKVTFYINYLPATAALDRILTPGMPLEDLVWYVHDLHDPTISLHSALAHITSHFHKTLRSLDVLLMDRQELVEEQLVSIITRCRQLTSLTITAILDVETVESLCTTILLDKRPEKLRHVKITVLETSQEVADELDKLSAIAAYYGTIYNVDIAIHHELEV